MSQLAEMLEVEGNPARAMGVAARGRAALCVSCGPGGAPHEMLLDDQRAVDGVLFARRIVQRLLVEEFGPVVHPIPAQARAT